MATSPLVNIAVVGMESGIIQVVDLTDTAELRIIHTCRLHQAPIRVIQ